MNKMDLGRAILLAKHNCDLVPLLQLCRGRYEPDKKHEAEWPAVFPLLKFITILGNPNDSTLQSINKEFYLALNCAYDDATSQRSRLSIIPKELLNLINLYLMHRNSRNINPNCEQLIRLGRQIIPDHIPYQHVISSDAYYFQDRTIVSRNCNGTFTICGPVPTGCEERYYFAPCADKKCRIISNIDHEYPMLAKAIQLWDQLLRF